MNGHCEQTELAVLALSLRTKAFQAHSPSQKASVLAFLVNELCCSKAVIRWDSTPVHSHFTSLFYHCPSSPSSKKNTADAEGGVEFLHLFHCCLSLATGENNGSSYFDLAMANMPPLCHPLSLHVSIKNIVPVGSMHSLVKVRLTMNLAKCRWRSFFFSHATVQYTFLHTDELKQTCCLLPP